MNTFEIGSSTKKNKERAYFWLSMIARDGHCSRSFEGAAFYLKLFSESMRKRIIREVKQDGWDTQYWLEVYGAEILERSSL